VIEGQVIVGARTCEAVGGAEARGTREDAGQTGGRVGIEVGADGAGIQPKTVHQILGIYSVSWDWRTISAGGEICNVEIVPAKGPPGVLLHKQKYERNCAVDSKI
jgi:hypothetical protein